MHARTQVVMVNSSWTRQHIARLWWRLLPPHTVYPPCNVTALAALAAGQEAEVPVHGVPGPGAKSRLFWQHVQC